MIQILVGYIILFIYRPFEIWPVLGTMRLEFMYMLVATLAWLLTPRKLWDFPFLHLAHMAFWAAILLSWFSSDWGDTLLSQNIVSNYFKQVVFYLMLVTCVIDESDLKTVTRALLVATGIYMAHSFREYRGGRHVFRMGIARMVGIDSSLNDPNSFAASVVYAMPLVIPVWLTLTSRKSRAMILGYVGLSVLCVILTGSRTAFASLLLWASVAALKSRWRFRIIPLFLASCPVIWYFMPPNLQNRFYTMIDPSVGPNNAQESAESRSEGFWTGVQLIQDYPVSGCGPGAWIPSTGKAVESHNLYGQVMGELGAVGTLAFAAIVILMLMNVHAVKAAYQRHPEWDRDFVYYLARAMGECVVLLLLMGWGGHNLYRYQWLWYSAFLITARRVVAARESECDAYCVNDPEPVDPRIESPT